MDDIVIIIPSYKPDREIMIEFIQKVKSKFSNIVVVDDGSGNEYSQFYEYLKEEGVIVLKHYINFGKGRGIKTAFNYVLNNYPNIVGAVTADCDGQHYIEDIVKCTEKLRENPEQLVIGYRNFDEKQVPFRSRFGNKLTRGIFGTFVGIKITDTQSGLRAFGRKNMETFLQTAGERYEYETNILIDCKQKDIEICEVPISTVYIRNNSLSHFNPIRDSIMIYKLFAKYIASSLSSFILDILLYTLFVNILPEIKLNGITEIVIATVIARIISAVYNFIINSKVVFKNRNKNAIIKYFVLCIIQMFISAFAVSELFKIVHINSTLIKVIVDTIIFIINFVIQREWVFKKK
jgi:putative flippase GtrA